MTPYLDFKTKKHLKQEKVTQMLNINNEFQTLNRLNSLRTGRKDDLEMLCNLLIYLSNYYELPDFCLPPSTNANSEHRLYFLQAYKKSYTLARMCKNIRNSECGLKKFCLEVDRLSYSSKPDYAKLR